MLSEQRTVERPGEQGATLAGAGREAHQKVGDRRRGCPVVLTPARSAAPWRSRRILQSGEDSGMALCPEGLAGSRVR